MPFCIACGSAYLPAAKFCASCGVKCVAIEGENPASVKRERDTSPAKGGVKKERASNPICCTVCHLGNFFEKIN